MAAAPARPIRLGQDADERVMRTQCNQSRECELRGAGKGDAQH
jgi:hypothetical protein